nr:hypothetical protein CFP56_04609 [Quercus suber]
MSSSAFHIAPVRPEDVEACMAIRVPSFEHMGIEQLFGNVDTPAGRKAAGEQHSQAWRTHATKYQYFPAIKCVHTDLATRNETIVGFAEWYIYDTARSEAEVKSATPPSVLSARDQERAMGWIRPTTTTREKWLAGRPAAFFKYMVVDRAWRRQGVASMCVRWGLEKCDELRIPAYLGASDEGKLVYERLGFEVVDRVTFQWEGQAWDWPIMIYWPPGTKDEEKVPADGMYRTDQAAT